MKKEATEKSEDKALVSVIIPTHNRAEMVCDCVAAVLRGDWLALEIIVVDDASTDNTGELLAVRFGNDARVRHVRNPHNVLTEQSRENGRKTATGAYLLFLDNDNIAAPDLVSRMVAVFEAHPDVGYVGALSIQARNDTIWTLGSRYNFWTSRPVNLHEGERVEDVAPSGLYETFYSPNAFMVSRAVTDVVGGFDCGYGMMYEEADFGYRVAKAGFRAVICADARTRHLGYLKKGEVAQLRHLGIDFPLRTYCFARNRSRFMRRWAPWQCLVGYYVFFAHAFCFYYCMIALRNRRPDIARAYFVGTIHGLFGIGKTK